MTTLSTVPVTLADLTLAYAAAGLFQFGRFEQLDGSFWPFMIHLRWLPSYPSLLQDTAATLAPLVDSTQADRLLTTADALPVGIALSLRKNIPLVYFYGEVRDYTAAFAIEGAYDVGHPTVLLLDVVVDAPQVEAIIMLAQHVGLNVNAILAVIDLGLGAREALESVGYKVQTLLTLRKMLSILAGSESHGSVFPLAMRATVEEWLTNQGA